MRLASVTLPEGSGSPIKGTMGTVKSDMADIVLRDGFVWVRPKIGGKVFFVSQVGCLMYPEAVAKDFDWEAPKEAKK